MPVGSRFALLAAALIGTGIGVATSFGQSALPGHWASLANAASPWLLGAFVAGTLVDGRRLALAAGLGTCLCEVAGYYGATQVRGFAVAQSEIVFWSLCAVVGGPLFGWAGWTWRHGRGRRRGLGAAFLPGTFIAEALGTYALRLHYLGDAVLFGVIGLLLLVLVARRETRATLLYGVVVIACGVLIYGPLLRVASGVAFGA